MSISTVHVRPALDRDVNDLLIPIKKVYFKKDLRAVVEKQAVMLEKVSREIV